MSSTALLNASVDCLVIDVAGSVEDHTYLVMGCFIGECLVFFATSQ